MAGLPIVATRLPELESYKEVVHIADCVQDMVQDVRLILTSKLRRNTEQLQQRRRVASSLTWEAQVEKIEVELGCLAAQSR